MQPIAFIRSPYVEKFGVPRQSGLAPHVLSRVEFEEPYRQPEFVRGLEQFSHLWLIWGFHRHVGEPVHPTVRPPRLGGNVRVGVFATRSPYRPNALGLSAVRLVEVQDGALMIAGADMVDGTPVYDIKPYLRYADCIEDATGGYTDTKERKLLEVVFPEQLRPQGMTELQVQALRELLAQDPRPAYQEDPQRIYHLILAPYEVDFSVEKEVARVCAIRRYKP